MMERKKINNLTGIRAWAAIWVIFYHWRLLDAFKNLPFLPIFDRGYWAVDLFFILSGFVIAYVYHPIFCKNFNWQTYFNYLGLRIARLYPIHLLTFLLYFALFSIAAFTGKDLNNPEQYGLKEAILNLSLVHAWGFADKLAWNQPSWSVSAEFFAYLVLFPLYWLLFRYSTKTSLFVLAGVFWLFAYGYATDTQDGLNFTYNFGILRIIPEFLTGYCLYVITRLVPSIKPWLASILVGFAMINLFFLSYQNLSWEFLLLPLNCFLLLGLYYGSPAIDKIFGNRIIVYLGEISYAIYMLHTFVHICFDKALKVGKIPLPLSTVNSIVVAFALLIVIIATSAFCFHYIENPARLWVKKYLIIKKS